MPMKNQDLENEFKVKIRKKGRQLLKVLNFICDIPRESQI
jgi:hypothetical protein